MRQQAVVQRLLRAEPFAEHRQLQRLRVADGPGQPGQRVPTERDAQLHLWNREPSVAAADAEVAGGGEDDGAADGEAVHGRDRDLVKVLQRRRCPAADARLVPQLQLVVRAGLAPLARVRPGGERGARTGQDHDTRIEVVR